MLLIVQMCQKLQMRKREKKNNRAVPVELTPEDVKVLQLKNELRSTEALATINACAARSRLSASFRTEAVGSSLATAPLAGEESALPDGCIAGCRASWLRVIKYCFYDLSFFGAAFSRLERTLSSFCRVRKRNAVGKSRADVLESTVPELAGIAPLAVRRHSLDFGAYSFLFVLCVCILG